MTNKNSESLGRREGFGKVRMSPGRIREHSAFSYLMWSCMSDVARILTAIEQGDQP